MLKEAALDNLSNPANLKRKFITRVRPEPEQRPQLGVRPKAEQRPQLGPAWMKRPAQQIELRRLQVPQLI